MQWVTPDETAAQFFTRHSQEAVPTGLPLLDAHLTLRPGVVLELAGPTGAAKTEILLQIAANLLCRNVTAALGAESEHVVVLDCDGKFDLLRLIQVLNTRWASYAVPPDLTQVLRRVHLVRCFSTLDLLLALTTLPAQLSGLQGRCKLLLVDNAAAFLWQDRAAGAGAAGSATYAQHAQHAHAGAAAGAGAARVDASRLQAAAAGLLQALSQQLRCPVVLTKQTSVSRQERSDRLVQRELFSNAWQAMVTHRVVLLPALAAGKVLQALVTGPLGTQVMAQWQAADFTGPFQTLAVTPSGGLLEVA